MSEYVGNTMAARGQRIHAVHGFAVTTDVGQLMAIVDAVEHPLGACGGGVERVSAIAPTAILAITLAVTEAPTPTLTLTLTFTLTWVLLMSNPNLHTNLGPFDE